ncbi:MAG: hypothetical protein ACRD2Q_07480 [Terriglobales bacterium]
MLIGLFVLLVTLTHGFLMLFSPRLHYKLLDWWTRADEWSKPKPGRGVGLMIHLRLAGIVLVILGGILLRVVVLVALGTLRTGIQPTLPAEEDQIGFPAGRVDGFTLIVGLGASALGFLLLVKPEVFDRWLEKNPYFDRVPTDHASAWQNRILGALFLAIGLLCLRPWFVG